jgi:SAM-dependent methyltransferase
VPGFTEFLGTWLPPVPARILQVGAGRGELSAHLRGRGYEVVAIDPHAHDHDANIARVAVEAVGNTMGAFDAVVAKRSLHHVDDLDGAMASITAALKTSGILVVQDSGWDLVDEATGKWMHAELQRLGHEGADVSVGAWLRRFRFEHNGLATFAQVRAALDGGFHEQYFEWVAYLADEYLDADPDARRHEQVLVQRGEIRPAAFRYVGSKRGTN